MPRVFVPVAIGTPGPGGARRKEKLAGRLRRAEASQVPSDADATEALSPKELRGLRSLGYIQPKRARRPNQTEHQSCSTRRARRVRNPGSP